MLLARLAARRPLLPALILVTSVPHRAPAVLVLPPIHLTPPVVATSPMPGAAPAARAVVAAIVARIQPVRWVRQARRPVMRRSAIRFSFSTLIPIPAYGPAESAAQAVRAVLAM